MADPGVPHLWLAQMKKEVDNSHAVTKPQQDSYYGMGSVQRIPHGGQWTAAAKID